MHTLSRGIVLRTQSPHNNKAIIFDQTLGKIICFGKNRLINGALITYTLEKWHSQYRLLTTNMIAIPEIWAQQDMLFMHHILEIAHEFLPEEAIEPAVFELLLWLYKELSFEQQATEQLNFFKHLWLCKFFSLIGIYPDHHKLIPANVFIYLISSPINIMFDTQYDVQMHKQIILWLQACIMQHPNANRLKTVVFYTGTYETSI